jgi:carbonyl reductase 1
VTDSSSVNSLAEHLKSTHTDGIDFIINNAGIAMDGFDANVVKTTLNCNYYSTLSACHTLLPLLKPSGRMVNVASTSGSLKKYSSVIRDRFLASKTESDITSIMQDFQSAVEAGEENEKGFPSAAYAVSKAGLIGGTRALARESKVLVNSCCPGYVNTDMSKGNGTKTPDEGAQTPVWLAIQDFGGKSGAFYRDEKEIEWEDL